LNTAETPLSRGANNPVEFARCFFRLANLTIFALDRLSRYEATLSRQVGRILFAPDALDQLKPQERGRRFRFGDRSESAEAVDLLQRRGT
jgi:hypothetical protein